MSRFANPAGVLGAHEAQLADTVALTPRGQVGLGAFALENGAATDLAGHVIVERAKLFLHRDAGYSGVG